jgi:osmotically-inducible protein OsmY
MEMTNEELRSSVSDELHWDPKIDNDAIAVSAENGAVTLRGTVGSLRQKREAKNAAERVYGVTRVENHLQVRLMDSDERADADTRGDVLQALMLDALVPATVDARVTDGFVTLTGHTEWQYQREEAESVAANVRGVVDVVNDITITGPNATAGDVRHAIDKAFKRNAKLDADELTVETEDGTVTLKGTVRSWAEHDEALDAAWAAPGVRKVNDHIFVAY